MGRFEEVEEEEEIKEEIITKEDKTSISPPNAPDDDHASFLTQDSPPSPTKIDDNSASISLSPKLEDENDVNNDVINNNDVDEIKFETNLHDKEVTKEEECTF